jgi:hypothetical protein
MVRRVLQTNGLSLSVRIAHGFPLCVRYQSSLQAALHGLFQGWAWALLNHQRDPVMPRPPDHGFADLYVL